MWHCVVIGQTRHTQTENMLTDKKYLPYNFFKQFFHKPVIYLDDFQYAVTIGLLTFKSTKTITRAILSLDIIVSR